MLMPSANTLLKGLINIGPTIAARLEAVGIRTVGDLRRVGPAGVYNLVKANNPGKTIPVCYYLYSLQGALDDVHWDAVAEKTKQKLLRQIK
jgi:DNA transformation protein and related proteins